MKITINEEELITLFPDVVKEANEIIDEVYIEFVKLFGENLDAKKMLKLEVYRSMFTKIISE